MKRYCLLIIIPGIVLTFLIARSCRKPRLAAHELIRDSIRIADQQADKARDSSNVHYKAYETDITTYENYNSLPYAVRDSLRAAYARDLARRISGSPARHSDSLRAAQTRSSQSKKKP